MRILHIWNTAGVASVIAKFMDRLYGTESLVIHRRAFDPFGVTTYGELMDCGAKMFALKCLLLARKFDIVHVHSFDKLIPYLKFLYSDKPLLLHYHGSDIRGKWLLKRKYWNKVKVILYSTLDLLDNDTPEKAIYIPNPVDTDLFKRYFQNKKRPKSALAFNYYIDINKVYSYAKKYEIRLDIIERKISYREMPKKLIEYEYYIDRTEIPSLSKTALEALACGLKVIRWDGKIIKNLPEEHKPENVIQKIWQIYGKILNLMRG